MLIAALLPKTDNCCILSTNIESINAKFSELDIFVQIFREQHFDFSAICIQQTWLSDKDHYSSVKFKEYKFIPHGNLCSSKGGFMIYLNEKFNYTANDILNKSKKRSYFLRYSKKMADPFVIN